MTGQNGQEGGQWVRGGMEALAQKDYQQAREFLEQAVEDAPDDKRVLSGLAEAYSGQRMQSEAIDVLQRSVQLYRDPWTRVRLGELQLENGQWLEARQQATLALESDRNLASAWVLRGRTERVKGRYHEALADFHRALSCDPSLNELQLDIAEVCRELNQPGKALAAVEQYISWFPEDRIPAQASLARGTALLDLAQFGAAVNALQIAAEHPEASAEAFVRLGQAQLLAGQPSAARMTLARAAQQFPGTEQLAGLVEELRAGDESGVLSAFNNNIPRITGLPENNRNYSTR